MGRGGSVSASAASAAEGGRGRPGRPKAAPDAAQRAAVIAEAYHLFVSAGFGGTTMDGVAARCRMSKRTLYRLFPGKAELFAAVVDAHRQSMLALPGTYGHLPLDAALEAIFRADISPEEDHTRRALLRLVQVEGPHYPELHEILARVGAEPSRMELARWLAAQAEAGHLVVDDAPAMARILMDMVFGAVVPRPDGSVPWPQADAQRAHICRCVRLFLNGALPRG